MYKKNFQKNLPNKSQPSKTLSDINHSNTLYDPPSRVMKIKAKIKGT